MKANLFFLSPLPRFSGAVSDYPTYFLLSQHGVGRCVLLDQSTGVASLLLGLRTRRTLGKQHPFTRDCLQVVRTVPRRV
ncbi:hypothetical protein BDV32DRAFT_125725 [Aspergillus pseudonomiae]|nr:hypothetical protein BDV32DRAFT_125725 [Aspergillus pseudonomiae]